MSRATRAIRRGVITLLNEIQRKVLHVALFVVPALYFMLPAPTALLGLIIATSAVVILDLFRLRNRRLQALFFKRFRRLVRERERSQPLGATYYVVGAFVCVVAFDQSIAIAALVFLVVGDTVAALIGRRFGKPRYWGKSIEGSAAMFATCAVIGYWMLGSWVVALAGALAATIAEAVPIPIDDNFRIPTIGGLIMQVVAFLTQG